ncbi:hypothetical protein GGF31_001857 [Allomyces arbusculus]|nr:hypothetical protein GGF31_001857 [Allomyces arbusculus]
MDRECQMERTFFAQAGLRCLSLLANDHLDALRAPFGANIDQDTRCGRSWTPGLIITAHRRLRKHAGIAPQNHLTGFMPSFARSCSASSPSSGCARRLDAWVLEFVPIAAMAMAYLVLATITIALLHRKISNLGFDRAQLIGDSAAPKAGGGSGGAMPSALSICEEAASSNVSASSLASVRDRRASAKPAVPVQLLLIRVEFMDLWSCRV